jgi:hypothetical protein
MQLSIVSSLLLAGTVLASKPASAPIDFNTILLKDFTKKTSTEVLKGIWSNARAVTSKKTSTRGAIEVAEDSFSKFFMRMTDASVATNTSPKADSLGKFLNALEKKDISDYRAMMLKTFGTFLDSIAKSTEKDVYNYIGSSRENVETVLVAFLKRADANKKLSAINASWLKVAHREMITRLQNAATPVLAEMPVPFWNAMMSMKPDEQVEMCRLFSAATVNSLSKDRLKLLTPACISTQDLAANAGFTAEKVKSLKDEAFVKYPHGVNEDEVKGLRGPQLKNFATMIDIDDRCSADKLPLYAINSDAIKMIDAVCLANYMLSKKAQPLGKLWEKIPENVFDSLPSTFDNAALAKSVHDDDKVHISSKLTKFFKYSKVVANMPAGGAINRNTKIEVDSKKLAKLQDKNIFAKVVSNKVLPDDILAYIDAAYFSDVMTTQGSNMISGVRALDSLITAPNKAKIIELLSSKITSGKHACSSIDSVDTFKSCKSIKEFGSDACFASLGFNASKEEIVECPSLAASVPFSEISEKFEDEDYKKMKESLLAGLVRGTFCSEVTEEKFNMIPLDALSAVNSSCFSRLSFEVTPEKMARFNDRVFEQITASAFAARKLTIANVTDKQLPFLSSSVTDASQSVIATLTEEDIKSLDKRITNLTAKQIAQLSEKATAKISPSNVNADALTMVSPAQVKALIPAFAFMSAAQVEKIGTENGKKDETIKILADNATSFNKEAFAAWEKRRGEVVADSEGLGAIAYCCIAGGAVLVLIIGFVGYRKFATKN